MNKLQHKYIKLEQQKYDNALINLRQKINDTEYRLSFHTNQTMLDVYDFYVIISDYHSILALLQINHYTFPNTLHIINPAHVNDAIHMKHYIINSISNNTLPYSTKKQLHKLSITDRLYKLTDIDPKNYIIQIASKYDLLKVLNLIVKNLHVLPRLITHR